MSKKTQRQQAVNRLSEIINAQALLAGASFDVNEYMNLVVEQVQHLTLAAGVVVELLEGKEMVYRAASGTLLKYLGLRLVAESSISGLCVATKKILKSDDTELDPRVNVNACRLVGARSLVVAPLFYRNDAIGVLKILSDKPNAFTDEDIKTLELMAGLIGAALAHQIYYDNADKLLKERTQALHELKISEEKLKRLATFDTLTNLPNRSLFMDRLGLAVKKAKRYKKLLAVFFLDVDHFKTINDTFGHDVGDELLKNFAARLTESVREVDTVARFGGDEFVILLTELAQKNNAISIAKKIVKKMRESFVLHKEKLTITTSIGISFFEDLATTEEQLLKQADLALYQAKKEGRNTFRVYSKATAEVEQSTITE